MMNNRINVFFNNLIIDKDDMPRAMRNLKSKGIEKHIIIKDKLMAYSESGMVRYTQIASIYRYDKRLRIVLYKYISFLEEWYRSIILDNYINKTKKMFKTEDLKEKLEEKSNLNDALELIDFPSLMVQIKFLPKRIKKEYEISAKILDNGALALRVLRNAVMHNKFLLLYRGFELCSVRELDDEKSATLKANIVNLISFLPKEVGVKCKEEINRCAEDRNEENETEWDLPSFVKIKI